MYRTVDKSGDTVDCLLTAKRDHAAARRYLERATNLHGLPEKIAIDKSGSNTAAIRSVNTDAYVEVELRQSPFPTALSLSARKSSGNSGCIS